MYLVAGITAAVNKVLMVVCHLALISSDPMAHAIAQTTES